MPPAIEITGLRKTFRDGVLSRRYVEALKDVSFHVDSGSIFGLLGPNGAGKTTLIKILLGLVYKTGGEAQLLDRPAGHRHARQQVGYLPEHHRIPRHLTGNAALTYYGGLSGLSAATVRRMRTEVLGRVGLEKWGSMPVRKYSKGMQQRLGLAQAMLHDPQILILDEPTDGVDPVGRREIRDVLGELKSEGKTIFLNSHLLQEIELVCDKVAILVEGRLQRLGTVEEITTRQQTDVTFTVIGDPEVIRRALDSQTILQMTPHPENRFAVHVAAAEQSTVNACIDLLRRAGVDILTLTQSKDSLEDAFLNIVGNTPDPAAQQRE
ncbi:MAG: ABC transporter ATP-binding protein [Blastopirellula sp.]|nr:ABC transporter ATP-binding protein [Blastopirellula sp.]